MCCSSQQALSGDGGSPAPPLPICVRGLRTAGKVAPQLLPPQAEQQAKRQLIDVQPNLEPENDNPPLITQHSQHVAVTRMGTRSADASLRVTLPVPHNSRRAPRYRPRPMHSLCNLTSIRAFPGLSTPVATSCLQLPRHRPAGRSDAERTVSCPHHAHSGPLIVIGQIPHANTMSHVIFAGTTVSAPQPSQRPRL